MTPQEFAAPAAIDRDLLTSALDYAARGWAVMPLHTPTEAGCDCRRDCGSVGKHPRTANGLKDATTDADAIRRYWAMYPTANIGLAVPDDCVVVDVDGPDGAAAIRSAGYPMTATMTAETGRGWHYVYSTSRPIRPAVAVLDHVDVRGPGSYIVAPPSLHANGKPYRWRLDGPPTEAPEWLYEHARPTLLASAVGDRIPSGERNATLASLAGSMRRRGMAEAAILAALTVENANRCEPPLGDIELRLIAASVARYDPAAALTVVPASDDDLPTVYSVGDLAALPSADEDYIIADGILTVGGKMLVYGKAGAGKTTMLDFLAGPLATGRPFLGRFAIDRPRRTLVVQGELSRAEMASHAQALVSADFDDPRLMFARMTSLKLPAGEDLLRRLIERVEAEVLILDPWYRLFSGESSDKSDQVDKVFAVCDRFLDSGLIDAAVVCHHANVTGLRTAGSWEFEAWPSTILRLEKMAGLTAQRKLSFEKIRAPGSDIQDSSLVVALGEAGYLPVTTDEPTATAGAIMAVQLVKEAGGQLHRQTLVTQLMARAGCKTRAANKYLGQAVQLGDIEPVRDANSTLYRLRLGES